MVDLALEKLRKMSPPIDIKFFIYRHDKDREQRTEAGTGAGGNFVDFMEFKKLQQAARRYHTMALSCIRKFWKCLLEPVCPLSLFFLRLLTFL